ncbi:hypothetical protein Tco_1183994 [Tanacetum coccineum]
MGRIGGYSATEGTYVEVVGWVEDDASLRCSSSTPFETRHPFHKKLKRGVTFKRKVVKQTSDGKGKEKVSEGEAALEKKNRAREKRIMVEDDVDFNKKKYVLPRGVTFKRKVVITKGRKSVGKRKEKVSEGEAALANENRAMKRGNGSWLKMMWVLTRKKHVLPRPNGIVIREGGSLNVGARSKNLLNVGEMLIMWEEIKLLEPGIVDQLLVTTSIEGLMLKWCIQ